MRLQQYLNEDIVKERIELIEKNCQPFLKQMKSVNFKNGDLLYSGRKSSDEFNKKRVRKDRNPTDTPIKFHNWLDDWFYKKFGIRARSNSVFCTGDTDVIETYGNQYVIFPIGKFKIIWNSQLKDLFNIVHFDYGIEHWIEEFLKKSKTYKTGDLQGAIKSKNEIMLHCKEYYILEFQSSTNAMVLNHFMETL